MTKLDSLIIKSVKQIYCNLNFINNDDKQNKTALIYPPFRPKIGYSYVIEVADSEYPLLFHRRPLVLEIFAFYHRLKYARARPGRRGHVHLGHNFSIQNFFQKFLTLFCLL